MYIKLEKGLYLIGSGLYGLSNWKDCSVYLISDGGESALVDAGAGMDDDTLYKNFLETGNDPLTVRYLLLTHAHGDHAGGLRGLKDRFPNAKIVTSAGEAYLLEKGSDEELGLTLAKAKGAYPKEYCYRHVKTDITVSEGDELRLGGSCIRTYIAAGHTLESVLYLLEKNEKKYLFCGDYIFLRGIIGLINAPGSTLEGYRESLPRIQNLPIDALLPGHREFALNNGERFLKMAADNMKTTALPPVM